MTNCLSNNGFETDTYWTESGQNGGVADRNTAGGHSGSFEGKIDISNPTNIPAYAQLDRNGITYKPTISQFRNVLGTFSYWVKIVAEATDGWDSFEIRVTTYPGSWLYLVYFHHAADISVPGESGQVKVIDMGTTKPTVWTQFSRNLRADYFSKFGTVLHPLERFTMVSTGYKVIEERGQDLRIDDLVLDTMSSQGGNPGLAGSSLKTDMLEG